MKRPALQLTLGLLCLLLAVQATAEARPVAAKETWTKVTSKHFTLIGNASEKDIRQVATRLEQFREVFTRIFSKARFETFVPTTVIVFKDMNAYKPFNPGHNAGYFQPGDDINYITLTAEPRRSEDEDPLSTIYHEYVHLLVKNNMTGVPLWVNEGLAEFYRTFDVLKDGAEVMIGKPISYHVLYLREQKFLPLQTLINVDYNSPYYNEGSKRGVFYAQSWALIHYLQFEKTGQRRQQFARYLQLLGMGMTSESAFRNAFQSDYETVEKEMRAYVNNNSYRTEVFTLKDRLSFDDEMQSGSITEAEAQAYLGDLLLHTNDLAQAEQYLRRALELDPQSAMAHASLGMLRFRQNRMADAQRELAVAVAANSQNYLAHYYYAFALVHEHANESMAGGFAAETAALIRTHLKRALELAPEFAEAYNLHAYVSLVMDNLDEADQMVKRALELAPGRREELSLTRAQILMRRKDYQGARQLLEPIAQKGAESYLRREAGQLLGVVKQMEDYEARRREFEAQQAEQQQQRAAQGGNAESAPVDSALAEGRPRLRHRDEGAGPSKTEESVVVAESPSMLAQLRPRAAGEEQAIGMLVQIECTPRGAILHVKAGERLLRLAAGRFEHVDFVSYVKEMGAGGNISCGPRNPANRVLVTYRPQASGAEQKTAVPRRAADRGAKLDGEAIAVDFIPADWK